MKTVLAIETSCDETGVAYVRYTDDKQYISLAHALNSQIETHAPYGGVFPMLAKREHGNNLVALLTEIINKTKTLGDVTYLQIKKTEEEVNEALSYLVREPELLKICTDELLKNESSTLYARPNIDSIVVTAGPGLEPALWVGISFAKFLSKLWNTPILPMNHMEGHIASVLLENKKVDFPALALLVSGGHTELVSVLDWGKYKVIGKTRDDAVGEAYDKVARILGLSYPGGPAISKRAEAVRTMQDKRDIQIMCSKYNIKLPRPMTKNHNLDFSFSGLKTAVLYLVRDLKKTLGDIPEEIIDLICYEFEESVVDVLVNKLDVARKENIDMKTLIVAGGVIANIYLRKHIDAWCKEKNIICHKPEQELATDNAVMIGLAGLQGLLAERKSVTDFDTLIAYGGWNIDDVY